MSEEKEYQVCSPLKKDGTIYKSGTVKLTDAEAQRFFKMGKADCPIESPEDYEPAGQDDGGSPDEPLTEARIVEAIGELDPANKEHWTKGGFPVVEVLEAILGKPITANERDAAWKVFQEQSKQQ